MGKGYRLVICQSRIPDNKHSVVVAHSPPLDKVLLSNKVLLRLPLLTNKGEYHFLPPVDRVPARAPT